MRIVFSSYDSPGNPFYGGGGARAIHEVARRLARTHVVEVVTAAASGVNNGLVDGVQYATVGPMGVGPKLGQLLFHFSLPWRAARRRYDVWCESLTPPFSTACLPLFTRQPVVALTQILAGDAMRRKYRLPFDRVERAGLQCYHWAVATSGFLRERLERTNPRLRIAVIPNGVPGDWVRAECERGGRQVLFLGRLDIEQKGLDLLLEALAQVATQLPLPVVLAGSGVPAAEQRLRESLARFALADRVRMVGRVDGDAKRALMRDAAFLVMPSRFEASPLVLLEAACHALPTVCFAIPELSDVPTAVAVKVPPFDVPALGTALLELARDPARADTMGRAAKTFVRDFDWDLIAARYDAFFHQATSTA